MKNKKRVGSVYFATEIKRTERNKQVLMSESTKVTKSEKALSFMSLRRNFSRGGTSTFCLSFSNC